MNRKQALASNAPSVEVVTSTANSLIFSSPGTFEEVEKDGKKVNELKVPSQIFKMRFNEAVPMPFTKPGSTGDVKGFRFLQQSFFTVYTIQQIKIPPLAFLQQY